MSWILLAGSALLLLVVLWIWAACAVGRRADDAMDRYFREQRARAATHGCGIKK